MIPARTQATLLLTVHLTASTEDSAKPLNVSEWNSLARWLSSATLRPEDLLKGDPSIILDEWADVRISKERLLALLNRGHALALLLDRWLGTGMWIFGRSDPAYPGPLKRRLGESAPPILFGYGDVQLFRNGGIAIVGSRDAKGEQLQFAEDLGVKVSEGGHNVVSGGARGIDERAAEGAFRGGGTVIAVLGDSLLRNAGKKHYRNRLLSKDLVLVTPYSPESSFNVGNAMGRNKLIYCLADAAIAVSSSKGSGGTFTGATENLKRQWVPLWVVPTDDPDSGNHKLVEQGGRWLPDLSMLQSEQLFNPATSTLQGARVTQKTYPHFHTPSPMTAELADQSHVGYLQMGNIDTHQTPKDAEHYDTTATSVSPSPNLPSLYQCFLEHWRMLDEEPKKAVTLAQAMDLTPKQTREWISRAEQQGLVKKLIKPVRYELVRHESAITGDSG